MPNVSQFVNDRKKLCPKVFEVFGSYPDTAIYRCDYSTRRRIYEIGRWSYWHQCAAEFCYARNPYIENYDNEWNTYYIPYAKTINLEILNNNCEVIDFANAVRGNNIRCKFCRSTVATVVNNTAIHFIDCDSVLTPTDYMSRKGDDTWIGDFFSEYFKHENNRTRNIPRMIKQYKEDNNITD